MYLLFCFWVWRGGRKVCRAHVFTSMSLLWLCGSPGTCIRIIFIAYLVTQNNYGFQPHRSVQLVNYYEYRHQTAIIPIRSVLWCHLVSSGIDVQSSTKTIEPTLNTHTDVGWVATLQMPTTSHSTIGIHVAHHMREISEWFISGKIVCIKP